MAVCYGSEVKSTVVERVARVALNRYGLPVAVALQRYLASLSGTLLLVFSKYTNVTNVWIYIPVLRVYFNRILCC